MNYFASPGSFLSQHRRGTCDERQKEDGYGPLVWIPIGLASISVAYGNGYVMIASYSLFAPVSFYKKITGLFNSPQPPTPPLPSYDAACKKYPRNLFAASFRLSELHLDYTRLFPRRLIKPDVILSMT
ncbi:hypothetical protein PAMP_015060 [Pampus punctatissimus]